MHPGSISQIHRDYPRLLKTMLSILVRIQMLNRYPRVHYAVQVEYSPAGLLSPSSISSSDRNHWISPVIHAYATEISVFVLFMATHINNVEVWTPPTFSSGKVPQVTPGKSRNQDIGGDFPLDQVVIDRECPTIALWLYLTFLIELPPGTQIDSCDRYGASAWTVTARITTTLANGEPKFYFLKVQDPLEC